MHKTPFHASIRKIEQYVHYLNEEKNNDIPLHDIKSITEFIGKFKILQPYFHSWKMCKNYPTKGEEKN